MASRINPAFDEFSEGSPMIKSGQHNHYGAQNERSAPENGNGLNDEPGMRANENGFRDDRSKQDNGYECREQWTQWSQSLIDPKTVIRPTAAIQEGLQQRKPDINRWDDEDITEFKYRVIYQRTGNFDPDEYRASDFLESGKKHETLHKCHRLLEALRDIPWPIRERLSAAKHVRRTLGTRYEKTNRNKKLKKENLPNRKVKWSSPFGLLDDTITKIQAYFGSSVASYFSFLRILLWLNLAIAVCCIAFITVPQLVSNGAFIMDLSQMGLGVLENSIAFYGFYEPTESFRNYYMPLAYFITVVAVVALSVVTIVVWMSVSYRKSKMSDTDVEYVYTWRVLSAWDFSLFRQDGILDRYVAIRTDFRELIEDEKNKVEAGVLKRWCLYTLRIFTNLIVLALLGGSGYAIYYVSQNRVPDDSLGIFQDSIEQYKLPVVVAGLKLIVPVIFFYIAYAETWTPRIEFNITLGRTIVFYYASLLVFILSLFTSYENETSTVDCVNGTLPMPVLTSNVTECWETEIGMEIYRVLALDLAASLGVLFVFDILRAVLVKCNCCFGKVDYKPFDVASEVLDLIYGQGLIWLGIYFSPLLPLVGFIKLVLVFALRYAVAKYANIPPKKLYRASRSGSFYMAILMVNLFVSLFPVILVFVELRPSSMCGPFRKFCFVYEVLTSKIGDLPEWLSVALEFIGSAQIIIPVVVLLLLTVVYFKTKSGSYKDVIRELRAQLKFERREGRRRVFHVARVTDTATGNTVTTTQIG